jgi:hypothetical protein
MAFDPLHRQIVTLADEPPIRNLQNLLKRLEVENPGSYKGLRDAMLDRKGYDKVIVDLRCPDQLHHGEIHGIRRIQASTVGRILSVTAEVNGPKTLTMVERYLVNGLPAALLWLISHRIPSPKH